MGDFLKPLAGIQVLWLVVCFETLIVIGAMAVDFFSGYYKAKLRGEARNSLGMKRTIGKFILYIGSVMIACGIDSIFFVCGFWGIVRLAALGTVPVITSVVAVFICAVEIRSVWEKADRKQKLDVLQTAGAVVPLVPLFGKEMSEKLVERLGEVIENLKKSNGGYG